MEEDESAMMAEKLQNEVYSGGQSQNQSIGAAMMGGGGMMGGGMGGGNVDVNDISDTVPL